MQLREEQRYTYADYASWDDDNRYELIDGIPYLMSPSPLAVHQEIIGNLHAILHRFLKGKICKVYLSPFDVRLYGAGDNDDTVVQPDIVVVCDKTKLDRRGCNGAPDMVVEVLSKSSTRHDRILKLQKYQSAGVREYWLIDPESNTLQVCLLKDGEYVLRMYGDEDTVPVQVLDGCSIDMKEVFDVETQNNTTD